jgi:hypothetical protein
MFAAAEEAAEIQVEAARTDADSHAHRTDVDVSADVSGACIDAERRTDIGVCHARIDADIRRAGRHVDCGRSANIDGRHVTRGETRTGSDIDSARRNIHGGCSAHIDRSHITCGDRRAGVDADGSGRNIDTGGCTDIDVGNFADPGGHAGVHVHVTRGQIDRCAGIHFSVHTAEIYSDACASSGCTATDFD